MANGEQGLYAMMSVTNDPTVASAPIRHRSHGPSGSPIKAPDVGGGTTSVQPAQQAAAQTVTQATGTATTASAAQAGSGASASQLNLLA